MEVAAIVFGLLSALTFGIGDFSGGFAARKLPSQTVVLFSQSTGLIVLIIFGLATRERLPTGMDLVWGAIAGIVGQIGLIALYRGMSIGKIGIVAPVSAVISAIIPVVFAIITQGVPKVNNLVGFALALIGVWFIAQSHESMAPSEPESGSTSENSTNQPDEPHKTTGSGSSSPLSRLWNSGLGLAMLAGVSFGGFLLCIAQVQKESVAFPLVAARLSSISLLLIIALLRRKIIIPSRGILPILLLTGVMDIGGNIFYVLAVQAGRLDIGTVLSSLFPAVTVFLALVLLRERLGRLQSIGVVCVLIAIPLIALH